MTSVDERPAPQPDRVVLGHPVELHVAAPVEVCSVRDVKGIDAQQRNGKISGIAGVDATHEVPVDPEVVVPAHEQSLEEPVQQLPAALEADSVHVMREVADALDVTDRRTGAFVLIDEATGGARMIGSRLGVQA